VKELTSIKNDIDKDSGINLFSLWKFSNFDAQRKLSNTQKSSLVALARNQKDQEVTLRFLTPLIYIRIRFTINSFN
jgi:hypothetical protein